MNDPYVTLGVAKTASDEEIKKAYRELGWKAQDDIRDMCRDSWNWQRKNPDGYGKG